MSSSEARSAATDDLRPEEKPTRNSLTELLERTIPELTPLEFLTETNREMSFQSSDGRIFVVSVEAYWPDAWRSS